MCNFPYPHFEIHGVSQNTVIFKCSDKLKDCLSLGGENMLLLLKVNKPFKKPLDWLRNALSQMFFLVHEKCWRCVVFTGQWRQIPNGWRRWIPPHHEGRNTKQSRNTAECVKQIKHLVQKVFQSMQNIFLCFFGPCFTFIYNGNKLWP